MSTIRCDNFGPSAGGTTYSARGIAKAWVNFNGTGTIAARDSENVSSLTDNGTGNYTVNFSSAFGAGDYATAVSQGSGSSGTINVGSLGPQTVDPTTTAFRFITYGTSFTLVDSGYAYLISHGDLA